MSLNTAIRNAQIKEDADIALDKIHDMADTKIMIGSGAGNAEYALSGDVTMTNAGVVSIGADKVTAAMINSDVAGDGIAQGAGGELDLDLNELSAAAVDVTADSIAIVDATDNSSKKESIADLATAMAGTGLTAASGAFAIDLNELSTEATFDVAADYVGIVDATDSGSDKTLWSVIATAIAGSGLTATNGVLSVDSITNNIVEDDIQLENESANCNGVTVAFTLSNTPLANSLQVYLNGLLQEEGSGKDYTWSGTTVTFATAPASGDILLIHYVIDN